MTWPRIDLVAGPDAATDLVLLAHGGEVRSLGEPHAWRAPILRMWPFAAAAHEAVPGAAVGLVRYRYRGWNAPTGHPAADLREVLERLPDRIRRVVLIGHSMGGRAVVAEGNHPLVSGILGLAPWLPAGEPLADLRGPVVLAHGTSDRITDPALTAAYARRLREAGLPVACLSVEGDRHAMLHRSADWAELVRRFTRRALGDPESCPQLSTEPGRVDELPRWNPRQAVSAGVRDIAAARLKLPVAGHL